MSEKETSDNGSFFTGMVLGGIAGFVAGMVLAPKSGDETRELFSERGQELRDKADDLIAAAKGGISKALSGGATESWHEHLHDQGAATEFQQVFPIRLVRGFTKLRFLASEALDNNATFDIYMATEEVQIPGV